MPATRATNRSAKSGDGSSTVKKKRTSNGKVAGAEGRLPNAETHNPVALLQADHAAVRKLFEEFDATPGDANKRDIANAICCALKVHARLEEELFYPAAAHLLDEPDLIEEAYVEHASARDLIAQIESGAPGDAFYDARVTVLSEYINHHVVEEEGELFPRVRKAGVDLDALGMAMARRKQELSVGFVASNAVIGIANSRANAGA